MKRCIIARIEATSLGLDIRTIVTSLPGSTPERLYKCDYCARGQAENLIKLHKTQLKSDRTSCSSACANQIRLILHTAAYWLLWTVRQAIPESAPLKCAEFTTLQNRIVKIGARVIETETCKLRRKRRKARATNPLATANVKPFPRTKTSAQKHPMNNPG